METRGLVLEGIPAQSLPQGRYETLTDCTDVLIIAIALGLLAGAYLLPGVLPHGKIKPRVRRGKLLSLEPQFILQTTGGVVCSTLVLTVTNAGRVDLECWLEWLDCRATNDLSSPENYGGLPGKITVASGQTGQVKLTALGLSNGTAGRVCCYSMHWQQVPSWSARHIPPSPWRERVLRCGDGWLWPMGHRPWNEVPEHGWAVGSNRTVPEFFKQVYGLEADDLPRDEAADAVADVALAEARRKLFLLRYQLGEAGGFTAVSPSPTERQAALEEAQRSVSAAQSEIDRRAARREARRRHRGSSSFALLVSLHGSNLGV